MGGVVVFAEEYVDGGCVEMCEVVTNIYDNVYEASVSDIVLVLEADGERRREWKYLLRTED